MNTTTKTKADILWGIDVAVKTMVARAKYSSGLARRYRAQYKREGPMSYCFSDYLRYKAERQLIVENIRLVRRLALGVEK